MPTIFTRGAASARGFGLFGTVAAPAAAGGGLWSWGYNNQGQLGLGNITNYSSPKQVGALTTWATVAAGNRHPLAVKTDGTLWIWGRNNSGQIGDNTTVGRSSPVQTNAYGNNWKQVACGYLNTAAVTNGDI